jgi:hypothetical protein
VIDRDGLRLRRELAEMRRSLAGRIEALESGAQKARAKSPVGRAIAWMGPALPSMISSIVLLALGFMVKDSVDLAIRRQQLQMSFAKDAQEQLKLMAARDSAVTQVEQAAVLVASFGPSSVLPLVNELRHGGNRALGAETGLQLVAIMDPETVCPMLARVLANPARLLGWEEHMRIARVLGAGQCVKVLPLLRRHEAAIAEASAGKPEAARKLVRDAPDAEQLDTWRKSVAEVAALLAAEKSGDAR